MTSVAVHFEHHPYLMQQQVIFIKLLRCQLDKDDLLLCQPVKCQQSLVIHMSDIKRNA